MEKRYQRVARERRPGTQRHTGPARAQPEPPFWTLPGRKGSGPHRGARRPRGRIRFIDVAPSAPPRPRPPLIEALAERRRGSSRNRRTDVAAAAGVPAANFGPGVQAQAHQKNEWDSRCALGVGKRSRALLARIAGTTAALALFASRSWGHSRRAPARPDASRSDQTGTAPRSSALRRVPLSASSKPLRRASGAGLGCSPSICASTARSSGRGRDAAGTHRRARAQSGRACGTARAEIRGTGELSANLFPLSDVALQRIPELVTRATTEVDPAQGKVTRVLVRRHLPKTDAVRFRVYVESPRLSGSVDFDQDGNPVKEPL